MGPRSGATESGKAPISSRSWAQKGAICSPRPLPTGAAAVQDYPHLELSLTDVNNQTLAGRVLSPDAYLGKASTRAEGLGAGASAQVNVRIDSQLPNAAGYHVELFFP